MKIGFWHIFLVGLVVVPSIILFAYGSPTVAGEMTGIYLILAVVAYTIKWFITPRKEKQKTAI